MQSVSVSPNGLKTETLCVGIKPDTNFLPQNLSYRLYFQTSFRIRTQY